MILSQSDRLVLLISCRVVLGKETRVGTRSLITFRSRRLLERIIPELECLVYFFSAAWAVLIFPESNRLVKQCSGIW